MDTSKPIRPEDIIAASDADIAGMNTRHIHSLFKRWSVTDHVLSYRRSWGDTTITSDEDALHRAVVRLQAELLKRPHVPNKKEGKELRRKAAKAKR